MSMKQQTIAEIASGSGSFDILVKALALTAQSGSTLLAAAADPHADLTAFAPTDEAFFSLAREFGYEGHDEQEAFDARTRPFPPSPKLRRLTGISTSWSKRWP